MRQFSKALLFTRRVLGLESERLSLPNTSERALDESHHNDRPTSPYSPESREEEEDVICAECKVLSWSGVASLQADGVINGNARKRIRWLNATFAELVTSRCPICRMLAHVKPASLDGRPCAVEALPAEIVLPHTERHVVSLVLRPDKGPQFSYREEPGSLAVMKANNRKPDFGPRLLQPNAIDYNIIKETIQYCDRNHNESCPGSVSAVTVLEGLQVIDVRTRAVIEAPSHCKYAALSYVWGRQKGENALDESLESPPLVIEDALSVCASLGLEFLWVDRFVSCCLFGRISEVIAHPLTSVIPT